MQPPRRLQASLKRLDRKPARLGDRIRAGRKPLAFIESEPDPLCGVPKGLPLEAEYEAQKDALKTGLGGDLRRQADAFKEAGRTDFYIVLCFEHSHQVDVFLGIVPVDVEIGGAALLALSQ